MSEFLEVYGASTHNLKNIDVKIPKNKLTVITGISGSGKSSLAFKTIYSIGQQKYLESLSSYARMFIGGMSEEALYKDIVGLSPTICIDQKTTTKTPRSTVGTITEIYDYYKLLYLNLGDRKCVKCGHDIKKDSISDVVDDIGQLPLGTKIFIKVPILTDISHEDISQELIHKEVLKMGCIRYMMGENIYTVNDIAYYESGQKIFVIIDRLVTKDIADENFYTRLKESIEMAFTS